MVKLAQRLLILVELILLPTAEELNKLDGSAPHDGQARTLADANRVVINHGGTMRQVELTDFETYFETALDSLGNVTSFGNI